MRTHKNYISVSNICNYRELGVLKHSDHTIYSKSESLSLLSFRLPLTLFFSEVVMKLFFEPDDLFMGGVLISPAYLSISPHPRRHSSISVEKSSQFPNSAKPTIKPCDYKKERLNGVLSNRLMRRNFEEGRSWKMCFRAN